MRLASHHACKLIALTCAALENPNVTCASNNTAHAASRPSCFSTFKIPHAGRRAMYVTFVRDALFDVIPEGQGYNDVVLATPGQPHPDAIA